MKGGKAGVRAARILADPKSEVCGEKHEKPMETGRLVKGSQFRARYAYEAGNDGVRLTVPSSQGPTRSSRGATTLPVLGSLRLDRGDIPDRISPYCIPGG